MTPGQIVTVIGGDGAQNLTVRGTTVNLVGSVFNSWTAGEDRITIRDALGALGSAQDEVYYDDGQGQTNLNAGAGNDTFVYSTGSLGLLNDTLFGGTGIDTLTFEPPFSPTPTSYDLDALAIFSSIEVLEFAQFGLMTIRARQSTLDEVTTIRGSAGSVLEVVIDTTAAFNAADYTITGLYRLVVFGSSSDNVLTGRDGFDSIDGGLGNDTIRGGAQADVLIGGSGIDVLSYEGSAQGVTINLDSGRASRGDAAGDTIRGFESVLGSSRADDLRGDAGENTLRGGSGDDTLNGAGGTDQLRGAGGSDLFVFQNARGSKADAARDQIMDFAQGLDRIDLSQIDAIDGGQDDAFVFRGTSGFGTQAGLIYEVRGNKTIVFGDVNGDQVADFSIGLQGVFTLTGANFIL